MKYLPKLDILAIILSCLSIWAMFVHIHIAIFLLLTAIVVYSFNCIASAIGNEEEEND
jgi:hypothetical protein